MFMSQEWQGPIKPNNEEIPPAENPAVEKPPKAEDKVILEKELSPEVVEMIMDKVKDIDKKGIAYSSLSLGAYKTETAKDRFLSALNNGLLGTTGGTANREEWIKISKSKPNRLVVHFNITGRTLFRDKETRSLIKDRHDPSKTEIANNLWTKQSGAISLLFDISKFKEDEPHDRSDFHTNKIHTYRAGRDTDYDPKIKHALKNPETGKWDVDPQYGFILSPRVNSRFFQGIVLTRGKEKNDKYLNKIEEIAEIMGDCYKEKQNMLLPIYDENGNLLWPKQMSYEEVKKFVAERDAKKKEKLDSETA